MTPEEFYYAFKYAKHIFLTVKASTYESINFIIINKSEDYAMQLYLDDFGFKYIRKLENYMGSFFVHYKVFKL